MRRAMSAFRLVQNGGELLVDGGQRGSALLQRHPPDLGELVGVVGEVMGGGQRGIGARGRGDRRPGSRRSLRRL